MVFVRKLRVFADIGRAQGIAVTASVAICGALSSTSQLQWYHVIYFTLISALFHTALNTYIAKSDVELDAHTYTPERNPIIAGEITERDAIKYFYWSSIICFLLIVLFFFSQDIILILTILCALLAFLWLVWYGYKGKFYLLSYDLSFSVSYAFWILFGVFAVSGMPTYYTWVYIGATIFATTAFAQWENGLKDVDADRSVGVRSFAVVSGARSNKKLGLHSYMFYGIGLKVVFLLFCFSAFLDCSDFYYLIFLLGYGIPSQAYILWRFGTLAKPIEHRRTILLDVALTGILVYSVIYGKAGVLWVIFLILYLIAGYLIGSGIQKKCEFKFGRFK